MDKPSQPQVNLLHPLASLEWTECRKMPVATYNAQAVMLGDKIYMGGGVTQPGSSPKLLIYHFTKDSWDVLETPTKEYALATYDSELVLIGGTDQEATNQLWVLDEQQQWTQPLPPMETRRWGATAVSVGKNLVVAGGCDRKGSLAVVEVYDGHQWKKAQSLPSGGHWMKSALHGQTWYLGGGLGHSNKVYCTSLESLIATTCSEVAEQSPVWKVLPGMPPKGSGSTPAILRNQLVTMGGGYSSAIHSFFNSTNSTNSWVHVGDLHVACHSPSTIVLPTGELLVVGGAENTNLGLSSQVFKANITVTSFPDGRFDMSALSRLEAAANISIFKELAPDFFKMASELHLDEATLNDIKKNNPKEGLDCVFKSWLAGKSSSPPTWKVLLEILQAIHMEELARLIKDFFNKTPVQMPTKRRRNSKQELLSSCKDPTKIKERQTKPDIREVAIQTHDDATTEQEHMQVLEELQQRHEADLQCIKLLTEENEELKRKLHQSHPDDMHTDMETTGYTRGMEVVAETSILITNQAQTFHWAGYGLKLHIPQGSLPAELENCRLHIKVGLCGQFSFPQNTSLVSAVYWIDSKPRRKFSKPIRMELQHCSKPNQSSKLSIVRAKCSQEILPYTFTPMEEGEFSPLELNSYGSIQLSHFSIFAVTQKGGEDSQYCASFYYSKITPTVRRVHFVITKDLAVFITAMSKHLKGAAVGVQIEVEFENDSVSLEIPLQGITEEGWSIRPLAAPVVTKKQVDTFVIGKRVPSCQLRLDWVGNGQPVVLCYLVALKGAKEPFNRLAIESDVDPLPQQPPQAGLDSEPELLHLNEITAKIPSKWRAVGVQLGLSVSTLDAIEHDNRGKADLCFSKVLTEWKNQVTTPYSWSSVVQALRSESVQENRLAEEIMRQQSLQ